MSSAKRTSLKQAKTPLDELFSKTDLGGAGVLLDAPREDPAKKGEKDGFALLSEEIKQKKHEQLRLEEEKETQLKDIRKVRAKTTEAKRQTTLIMYDYQLDWLEMKRAETRIRGGKPLSMAKLLRAMVDLLMESPVDLAGVKSEEEIKERLERGIKKKKS